MEGARRSTSCLTSDLVNISVGPPGTGLEEVHSGTRHLKRWRGQKGVSDRAPGICQQTPRVIGMVHFLSDIPDPDQKLDVSSGVCQKSILMYHREESVRWGGR